MNTKHTGSKIMLSLKRNITGSAGVSVELDGRMENLIALITLASIQSEEFKDALDGYFAMKNHPSVDILRNEFKSRNS